MPRGEEGERTGAGRGRRLSTPTMQHCGPINPVQWAVWCHRPGSGSGSWAAVRERQAGVGAQPHPTLCRGAPKAAGPHKPWAGAAPGD